MALWSASSTWVAPVVEPEDPGVLDPRLRRDRRRVSSAATDGQHLEDGARLVDGADDRIDEAGRVARRRSRRSRCRRTRGRRPRRGSRRCTGPSRRPTRDFARSAAHAARISCSTRSWSPASIVSRRSSPGEPGSLTTALRGSARRDVPLGLDDLRLAAELRPGSTARRRTGRRRRGSRSRGASPRASCSARRRPGGRRGPAPARAPTPLIVLRAIAGLDLAGDRRVEAVGEDDVLPLGRLAVDERRASSPVRPRIATRVAGRGPPLDRRDLGWRRDEPLALDRGREDHDARSGRRCRRARLGVSSRIVVCWNASSARRSCWPTCQYASRASSAEPTVAKTISRKSARRRESVRPIVDRSIGSAAADDDRRRQLGQPGVHRHLSDGRLLRRAG